ncbi:hypothetical protein ACP4OV_000669 [Aristida adscensionis]
MSSSFWMQTAATASLLFLAVAPVLAVAATSPAIATTCAALATQPKRDYCVRALSGDPAAADAADARGVAAAAVNMSAHRAASTLRVIGYLVDELGACRGYYGAMMESLAGALADVRDGGRLDGAALDKAEKAVGQPDSCDVLLLEGNSHKDPISQENRENGMAARLATEILYVLASKRLGE